MPVLGAGEAATIRVTAALADSLPGLREVSSTLGLWAASTLLTGSPVAVVSHQVDGLAPVVAIDASAASAISAGAYRFTGSASDGDGLGVDFVEVSFDGATWHTASGTLAWSVALDPPSGAS